MMIPSTRIRATFICEPPSCYKRTFLTLERTLMSHSRSHSIMRQRSYDNLGNGEGRYSSHSSRNVSPHPQYSNHRTRSPHPEEQKRVRFNDDHQDDKQSTQPRRPNSHHPKGDNCTNVDDASTKTIHPRGRYGNMARGYLGHCDNHESTKTHSGRTRVGRNDSPSRHQSHCRSDRDIIDAKVRRDRVEVISVNSRITTLEFSVQIYPMITIRGDYPPGFYLPKRFEEFLQMSDSELDRIMAAYGIPSTWSTRGERCSNQWSPRAVSYPISVDKHKNVVALLSFLGAYRLAQKLDDSRMKRRGSMRELCDKFRRER